MLVFDSETTPLADIARRVGPVIVLDAGPAQTVRQIVTEVKQGGDAALLRYTRELDWPQATAAGLRAGTQELAQAASALEPETYRALQVAIANVRRFHERQKPGDWWDLGEPGAVLGQKFTPLDAVGIYAPGGRAAYLSSLVMAAVPAQVAGVARIAVASPPGADGRLAPPVAAAAGMLGLTEVYKLGGAQAVAALAYGTDTVRPVDKIVGPGNIYVTLAKTMVYGQVGTDGLYGPSELVVIADDTADPALAALDLLSQAEHGPDSVVVLVTTSRRVLEQVEAELQRRLPEMPRRSLAEQSLLEYGALVLVRDLAEAAALSNLLAPEHVLALVAEPLALLPRLRHAGCILLGRETPVSAGDYLAGPSHILPTGGTARFGSGLGVVDFMKRSSVIYTTGEWLRANGEHICRLARYEELDGHARAVEARTDETT